MLKITSDIIQSILDGFKEIMVDNLKRGLIAPLSDVSVQ